MKEQLFSIWRLRDESGRGYQIIARPRQQGDGRVAATLWAVNEAEAVQRFIDMEQAQEALCFSRFLLEEES